MGWARCIALAALVQSGCWQWCDDNISGWMRLDSAISTGGHVLVSWSPSSDAPSHAAALGADGSWTTATPIDPLPYGAIVRGGDAGVAVVSNAGFRVTITDPLGDHARLVQLTPPAGIGDDNFEFDAAWRGNELIVIGAQREQISSPSAALWIAAIGADGTVRAAPRVLADTIVINQTGAITVGATTWVVWTRLVPPGVDETVGARIGDAAALVDTRVLSSQLLRHLVSSGTRGLAVVDNDSGGLDAIVLDESGMIAQHAFAGRTDTLKPFEGQGYLGSDGWYDRDGNRVADPPTLPLSVYPNDSAEVAGGVVIHTVHASDRSTLYTAPLPFAGAVGADEARDDVAARTTTTRICAYH
ncbi:MAG TPA: hypothetical protein VL463_21885 [Kofleriaceae bacterium]|nr:hypothetical protein [Kofleriaceae bacterium]